MTLYLSSFRAAFLLRQTIYQTHRIESNRFLVSQHTYDFLVVAVGMQLQMDKIKGLKEALKTDSRLCL